MTDEIRTDEEFPEQSFQLLNEDAAPPDAERIAAVTKLAGDAFTAVAEDHGRNATCADNTTPVVRLTESGQDKGSGMMLTFAKPLAALITAAAVLVVAWFAPTGVSADVTLGSVLDQALKSGSLQLDVKVDGKESSVLVSGTSVRWEDSQKQYRIATGTRLWKVDEERETVRDEAHPWLTEDEKNVDLLALLGSSSSSQLRAVRPEQQLEHAGVLCNVFVYQPKRGASALTVRAFADAETNELYTVACWPRGANPETSVPLAELRLVKRNVEFDESKFVIGGNLSRDGRIGTIREVQGTVQIRPKTHRRWTLVTGTTITRPGDWIRTDMRGANAVSIALRSHYRLILGPGSLLELTSSGTAILHRGEVNVAGSRQAVADFQLHAPSEQRGTTSIGERNHFLLDRRLKLTTLKEKPVWLAGFDGSSNNESIGSLIAKVEDRDVPLTVGVHKVNVEIRDQIARTTIEESFVNRTHSRLEGVFHFPLPQDASISGFGMWINGELIEADVVEKQRAREIYETILRERRDPGLLEWSGGNIFKARVFPIEPHSEKRIRIVYTQVLPMKANRYRYSYALRSEMLQKTPLRELSLNVLVHSALPLKAVTCATHSVRTDLTEHSASMEFDAQEYTPTRDFEVVCEVDAQESDVVVVPHQRGDDGYFLAQVTPPSPAGNWQREILPDGRPLRVLLVCDTSGSMDSVNRQLQAEFAAAILSSLSEVDSFNIAYCDVDTQWQNPFAVAAEEKAVDSAVSWLQARRSLGWTDLDRMTKSAIRRIRRDRDHASDGTDNKTPEKQTDLPTHIIYVGDGIATARDADPQAFVNRVRRMTDEVSGATFHAVSVGSSFESAVLKSIAAIGGGSVRQISGEQTPQRTARELLNEMAQPGLRDMKVEFKGIQVAAVYPGELPNLAAGTQQLIVGRYLPTGEDQTGEIVVTGMRNGEPVRYVSRITMNNAEAGNSFIPRLWARAHLDHLLEQGSSDFIRDQVVALSEEFHIMTPYTSLLVLETDADRERFGVKRRFLMRDGEQFFADGRSEANFELLQQQMKAAGNWRLEMRRSVLTSLAGLGRDPNLFQPQQQYGYNGQPNSDVSRRWGGMASGGMSIGGGRMYDFNGLGDRGRAAGLKSLSHELQSVDRLIADNELQETSEASPTFDEDGAELDDSVAWDSQNAAIHRGSSLAPARQQQFESARLEAAAAMKPGSSSLFDMRKRVSRSNAWLQDDIFYSGGFADSSPVNGPAYGPAQQYTTWLTELFPQVPTVPLPSKEVASDWPAEARAIAESLMQKVDTPDASGMELQLTTEYFDARWDRLTTRTQSTELYSSQRWLTAAEAPNSQRLLHWTDAETRGLVSRAYQTGTTRRAVAADVTLFRPGQRPWSDRSLAQAYTKWGVKIEQDNDNNTVLRLTSPVESNPQTISITIDTKRHVILRVHVAVNDKQTSDTVYLNHVEAAGCWWPQKIEMRDSRNRVTSATAQKIRVLSADDFDAAFRAALPAPQTLILRKPLPKLSEARVADDGATAGMEEYLVLLRDACGTQNWQQALRFLKKAEAAADGKPGILWVRQRILAAARKNNEVLRLCESMLDTIRDERPIAELFLAQQAIIQAGRIADRNEFLRLLDHAKPIFERQPPYAQATVIWKQHVAGALNQLGRVDDSLQYFRELAEAAPWDVNAQTIYAWQLSNATQREQATMWLRKQLDREAERTDYEIRQLRTTYADLLRKHYMVKELIPFLQEWMDTEPAERTVYDQYLAALMMANRTDEAEATVHQWLKDGQQPEELKPHLLEKLRSAVAFGLGERYQQYQNRIDPRWREPLAEVANYFLTQEHHLDVTSRIVTHHRFSSLDQAQTIRRRAAEILKETVDDMATDRLSSFVNWSLRKGILTAAEKDRIAATLRDRWDRADEVHVREQIGSVLLNLYRTISPDELHLQFLRDRISRSMAAEDALRTARHTHALFQVLINSEWNEAHEIEAFGLLMDLMPIDVGGRFLTTPLTALHQVVDSSIAGRIAVNEATLQSAEHPEDLTRRELAKKRAQFRSAAQKALVVRLKKERDRLKGNYPTAEGSLTAKALRDWMQIERMHLEVQIADAEDGDFPMRVVRECFEILGNAPVAAAAEPDAAEVDPVDRNPEIIQQFLHDRVFLMVSHLSLRRAAPQDVAARVMDYIDKGMQLQDGTASAWRSRRISMLIALDQPEQLEKDLRDWIRAEKYAAPLQLMLARLLAEQGKITDGIQLMETVRRRIPLDPSSYATLANWYLVADRRDDYEDARVAALKSTDEWRLQNWLSQRQRRWTRTDLPLPSELDESVLFAFRALFEKSSSPGSYVYLLRNFYTACRDFRLLQMVPDSIIGRTPQQVYEFLTRLERGLLDELRNEATADKVMERLQAIRKSAESVTDQRALDLLEAMIERRSATVMNEPGPHIEAAVAALQRAFRREWSGGEVVQMATFLEQLGTIQQQPIADERLRQLRALHKMTEPGTEDHFRVSWQMSSALYHSHGKKQEALSVMEVALTAWKQAHPGGLPGHLNNEFSQFIGLLKGEHQYARAETLLRAELSEPASVAQRYWALDELNNCYHGALQNKAQVSLGSGSELYQNLLARLLKELKTEGDQYRKQVFGIVNHVFRTAESHAIDAYRRDLSDYAFKQLPILLKPQISNYRNIVSSHSSVVEQLLGKREALRFLIEQMEIYPARLEYTWENGWQQFAREMAQLRHNTAGVEDLEPQLLKIVLKELRRDLSSGNQRNRSMMDKDNYYFWEAKAQDFARVANEVAAADRDSGRSLAHVAEYLFHDLHLHNRAIEILLDGHDRAVLDESQQMKLVDMLHRRTRHAESIPILEPLVRDNPDNMKYATHLILAYSFSKRPQKRDELLAATTQHFRDNRIWNESNVATLAKCCLDCRLYQESVDLYGEVISMHQRTAPNQGVGGGKLSEYYRYQAFALSGLGRTIEAVDAASAGVVAWGRQYSQRASSVQALQQIIADAKDLDAYVKHLDEQAAQNGTDSSLIRKKIGTVYASRAEHRKAIVQLNIALEIQPHDSETHKQLIKSYEVLKDEQGAVSQMLTQLDFDRHNLELYQTVADRLADDEELAERALTSLIESAPLEASHHQALAERREKQNRWQDAIAHWQQVADLRSLEPTGLVQLAEAQIHERLWRDAQTTLDKLSRTEWSSRFSSSVRNDIRRLQNMLPKQAP